eukprot:9437364-Alexandrium_andersonii.AAC.1
MPSGTPPQGRGTRFGAAACSDHGLSWHFLLIYPWCVPSLAKVGCQSAGSGVLHGIHSVLLPSPHHLLPSTVFLFLPERTGPAA